MEHEEEYIPELSAIPVPTTPAVPDTRSDVALRRELAFHKNESARKDDIMRRHGIPTQPVPVAVPVASPAIDPRAVAHEVTGAVHNEIDGLRLEMSELKQGQADILKHLQHADGYEVTPAGNPAYKVGPPTGAGSEASGTKSDVPADKATGTSGTANPDDMPGWGYPPSKGLNSRKWVPMTLGAAEAKGISWRRTEPNAKQAATKKNNL